MASAWGNSWGVAWGVSWDIAGPAPEVVLGGKTLWGIGLEQKHNARTYHHGYPKSHRPDVVQKAAAHMSSLGGHARAESLTSKQRTAIATAAANARWKK